VILSDFLYTWQKILIHSNNPVLLQQKERHKTMFHYSKEVPCLNHSAKILKNRADMITIWN